MVTDPPSTRSINSNVPDLSVSELAGALKRTLEESFGRVRVRGELSRVTIPASGHLYTALKDDGAVIDAVCWKTQLSRLNLKPEEGLDVICTGRITTYPARSTYQLIIEQMELAGVGAMLKMIEDRRIRLAAEGLFDEVRKRPLPAYPQTIGVITSVTGAVIRDILHRIRDRYPCNVLIWPVTVQGNTAAAEIIAAIEGFNSLPIDGDIARPDVLIVARGGGSIEDLMPFNDEALVRAAARSSIPLISAVGHETDTTLIDYAADKRAPTPTAAAEFAVPVHADLVDILATYTQRLGRGFTRVIREQRHRLDALAARLGTPQRMLELPSQRLDQLGLRLTQAVQNKANTAQGRLSTLAAKLRHPSQMVADYARLLNLHVNALNRAGGRLLEQPQQRLSQASRLLETLSFHRVLTRGYAVVRDQHGHLLTNGKTIKSGDSINILLGDKTTLDATVTGKKTT
jgi:exodeoxyribonuclease VII large subunit